MSLPTPYCTELVHNQSRILYWVGLFIPSAARNGLYAIYSLQCELAHVRHAVSEEMIGHIRYAWWREHIEALYANQLRQGHPVLEGLFEQVKAAHIREEDAIALIGCHAESFPEAPPQEALDEALARLSEFYIEKTCPKSLPAWQSAWALMTKHQEKWGDKKRLRLLVKLAWLGMRPRVTS